MSEDYGSDILTLTDDDGVELEMEVLDSLELRGVTYTLLWPLAIGGEPVEEDSEEAGFVILRMEGDDEDTMCTVDSEDEVDEVYTLFMQRLEEAEDEDDDEA